MTPAEFRAASIGHAKEEEVRLKLLAWQVGHTMPAMKRRPSIKKLYRGLTGKGWSVEVTEDDEAAAKEKAVSTLNGMTEQGMKNRKTPKQRALDLGAHVFERRQGKLNGS